MSNKFAKLSSRLTAVILVVGSVAAHATCPVITIINKNDLPGDLILSAVSTTYPGWGTQPAQTIARKTGERPTESTATIPGSYWTNSLDSSYTYSYAGETCTIQVLRTGIFGGRCDGIRVLEPACSNKAVFEAEATAPQTTGFRVKFYKG